MPGLLVYVWVAVAIIMGILEAITLGLTTILFIGGALVALIVAICGGPLWLQIVLFLVVSVILLMFTRPIVTKYFNKRVTKTNIDAAIGKKVKVIVQIDNDENTGYVSYNGVEWMARSESGAVIPKDTMVEIVAVEGVKLIVR